MQLHTIAAYYPEKPSDAEQRAAKEFIASLAVLYPCKHCAADFVVAITESPPVVSSRAEFAVWVCEHHNLVNQKLGE